MIDHERLIDGHLKSEEQDTALRPHNLGEFVGQKKVCDNLSVFIEAARGRVEAMDHVLLSGPPGLGKTTLAQIIARELGVGFKSTSGPTITKTGDLAALLTNLESRDVLFIDEIHRLNPVVEEVLYPAMEDFELDIMIGEGAAARSVKIDLQPFTLIGATTRSGLLTTPLRDRFGIQTYLKFYEVSELEYIIERNAELMHIDITKDAATEIANRSRKGVVKRPERVVAPINVKGCKSILTDRAAAPSPIIISNSKSSIAGYRTSSTTGFKR